MTPPVDVSDPERVPSGRRGRRERIDDVPARGGRDHLPHGSGRRGKREAAGAGQRVVVGRATSVVPVCGMLSVNGIAPTHASFAGGVDGRHAELDGRVSRGRRDVVPLVDDDEIGGSRRQVHGHDGLEVLARAGVVVAGDRASSRRRRCRSRRCRRRGACRPRSTRRRIGAAGDRVRSRGGRRERVPDPARWRRRSDRASGHGGRVARRGRIRDVGGQRGQIAGTGPRPG